MISDTSDTPRAVQQEALAELAALPSFLLRLEPLEAWIALQQLQLAHHHPRTRGPMARIAQRVASRIQDFVAPSGTRCATIAARGWNPAPDGPLASALQLRDAIAELVDRARAAEAVLSTLARQDEARGAYYDGLALELAASIRAVAPGAYPALVQLEQTE